MDYAYCPHHGEYWNYDACPVCQDEYWRDYMADMKCNDRED